MNADQETNAAVFQTAKKEYCSREKPLRERDHTTDAPYQEGETARRERDDHPNRTPTLSGVVFHVVVVLYTVYSCGGGGGCNLYRIIFARCS